MALSIEITVTITNDAGESLVLTEEEARNIASDISSKLGLDRPLLNPLHPTTKLWYSHTPLYPTAGTGVAPATSTDNKINIGKATLDEPMLFRA